MKEQRGKFLVLRKFPYRESDLIIHALSETGEKMSFIARSALRSKKRFGGGVLEPSHHVNFIYNEKQTGGLHLLVEAELINDFPGIRKDYDRLEFALQVLRAAAVVSLEGDVHSGNLYLLVGHTLKALEKVEDVETLKLHFYIKFLRQQGVLPENPWLEVFAKQTLHASDTLKEIRLQHQDETRLVYQVADDYLKTAESHQSFLSPRG